MTSKDYSPIVSASWVARLGAPRPLCFASPDEAHDLPAHVRAGSGLRRWGEHLVIVQDDVNALALLHERTGALSSVLLPRGAGGRRQFSEELGNKAAKMDLESCVVLPDGRLLAFGSGSTAAREQLVLVTPDLQIRVIDGRALYAGLSARSDFAGSELNIEGAVVVGDRLRLFQRGNGAIIAGLAPVNAVGDLQLGAFLSWLDAGGPAPQLCAVRAYDLGQVGGVPFSFTDATALPDGRVIFLAGAEDSPDTYADGDVLGARVGLLDEGEVLMTDILDAAGRPSLLKLEGIEFTAFTPSGGLAFAVVADMDDPEMPTVLASLVWGPV